MNRREFDNILNDCLEGILNRGETVPQCLDRHPEYAAELKPLLDTALSAREAVEVVPRPEFLAKARQEFRRAIPAATPSRAGWFWGWRPQMVAVMASVLILLLGGAGTVAAAGQSMPDGILYPVKRVTETVQVALTPSVAGKAELYARLADRRVAEIKNMAAEGKGGEVDKAAGLLDEHLVAIADLVAVRQGAPAKLAAVPASTPVPMTTPTPEPTPPPVIEMAPREAPEPLKAPGRPEPAGRNGEQVKQDKSQDAKQLSKEEKLKSVLERHAVTQTEALRKVLEEAPESAKPAVQRALELAENGYEQVLRSLE